MLVVGAVLHVLAGDYVYVEQVDAVLGKRVGDAGVDNALVARCFVGGFKPRGLPPKVGVAPGGIPPVRQGALLCSVVERVFLQPASLPNAKSLPNANGPVPLRRQACGALRASYR